MKQRLLQIGGRLGMAVAAMHLLAPAAAARGLSKAPRALKRIQSAAPRLMKRYQVPGVAVALLEHGRLSWAGGFGRTEGGEAITGDTVFQAASLGKPLFATVVASYAVRGALDLDRPLSDISPLPADADPRLAPVTARMILSHSSGITWDDAADRLVVATTPGTAWKYSGAGYAYLQRRIEALSGKDLQAFAAAELFDRLGMTRSGYVWREGFGDAATIGHDRRGRAMAPARTTRANAASSLHSSAADYGRFLASVLSSATQPGKAAPGSPFHPVIPVDPKLGLYLGTGWALETGSAHELFFHWGSNPGFKSLALGCPEDGSGLVVLTNGDNGLELALALARLVDPSPHPAFSFYMLHPDD